MKIRHQKLLGLLACAIVASAVQVAVSADYQSTVLSQGPVGYWRLNETIQPQSGIVAVNSGSLGSSENGAYIAFPTRGLPGPFAGSVALGFDGSASYVSNAYQAAINTTAFTFEIWANPAQVPKFAYLASSVDLSANRSGWYMAQDDGSTFLLGNGFVVRMFYQNGANPAVTLFMTNDLPLGSWYHIVLTYDGTTAKFYKNGVQVDSKPTLGYVGNVQAPFTIGCRSSLNFFWPGKAAEAAEYNTALSAARVAAHYTAGTTSPGTYAATVQADSPLVYQRYQEPIDPPAANLGTAGAAANGLFIYDAQAGVAGPSSPPYAGFEAANKAASFDAGGGVVRIPALNLNTNTVTISGWAKATTDSEAIAAGLIVCNSGPTYAGLTIDAVEGGLGLGYVWNNDPNTYNVRLTADLGLPTLPSSADNQWAYVALVVQPTQAGVFICQSNNPASFAGVTNFFNHVNQAFGGPTLFGADISSAGTFSFAGGIDEVAIFNRALGVGELYTQYGAAVGGVAPKIFTDLQGPTAPVAVGDPIILTIDAGGTPSLTYTWHRNGGTIATTSTGVFTIPTSALTDTGDYDVTISNGSGSAPSQQVHVTVVNPTVPAITGTSGFVNRRLYTGGTINLSITATGGGLKYQWYKNASPISGATASAFTIASAVITNAGSYSVSATNILGSVSNGPAVISIPNVPAGGFEAAVIASGPEAWWRLDEAPGTTNLWDGMGRHDGYYTNVVGTVPPVSLGAAGIGTNTAASFTTNGAGVIPYALILNGSKHTYEGWIKTSVLNKFMVPYSSTFNNNGVWWAEVPNGFWTPDTSGGYYPISPLVAIASGVWTHLVMTYDDSIVNTSGTHFPLGFFINGVNISGAGVTWTDNSGINTGGPIIIGGRGVSATVLADSFFSGLVDDVAVYAKVLSATEIANHFAVGFPSTPPTFAGAFIPQTVTTGKTVSFGTTVQGTAPISLQWYKNSSLIAGATTNSFTITNTAVSDTATYTLWATNSVGTNSQSVSLTVIPATGTANVTNNLVLHLRFDGDDTDSSGRGHNGTPAGGPSFVTGVIGSQARQYTTTSATNSVTNIVETGSSYVKLGTPSDLLFGSSSSFTVGLWVKVATNDVQGDLPFIGTATNSNNNPGWDLSPSYGSGAYQWNLNDGTNNVNVNGPANSINDGGWHHFVMAVDRASHTVNTYSDGVLSVRTDIASLGSLDVGGPVTIGQDPTGSYPFAITNASATDFAGWVPAASATLDDIGIWRRALTPLEVAQIESAGRTAGHSFDTVGPAGVTLTISKSGSNITISWPSGTLYQSDSIGAGAVWTPVAGATAPSYTFTPGSGNKFYRVQ
jgi:Concanavalin A-like lectin/glucanases superfamily/Immunoglobulin I-set domain